MRIRRCEECGQESSVELAKWFSVSYSKNDSYLRDFCSEKCIASFYMRRRTKLELGTVRMIVSADIPEGEAYFISDDGSLLSIKVREETF